MNVTLRERLRSVTLRERLMSVTLRERLMSVTLRERSDRRGRSYLGDSPLRLRYAQAQGDIP
jgi:hypothetical protein